MDKDGAELVGSGGLRVDPARAFAVLRGSQLPHGFWRPLLWLRLAAAAGAREVRLRKADYRLLLEFDGEPLAHELLKEPFGVLAAGTDSPAARWLAWALVHTLRDRLTVTVSSGRGEGRRAWTYAEGGAAEPAEPAAGELTVVDVGWRLRTQLLSDSGGAPWFWFARDSRPRAGGRRELCDGVPYRLSLPEWDVLPWELRREPETRVRRDGARRVRTALTEEPPRLRLWHWGVLVHEEPLEGGDLPVRVDLDDPALTLDASLAAPVRDAAFEAARADGRRLAGEFLGERLERHARSMERVGRLLGAHPWLRLAWGWTVRARHRRRRRRRPG
ncbi:MAG: hypothetical protein KGL53_10700, partial [Elusimicrobia bacterium]|nr:hypothetical protein [Elusimicrobiota bacterium]